MEWIQIEVSMERAPDRVGMRGMVTGISEYEMEWVEDGICMRWSGCRIR